MSDWGNSFFDELRKFSDPSNYDNSIDWDDAPDGSEGGYTRHGNYINPDAMMELVKLRAENDRLAAQLAEALADQRRLEWLEGLLQAKGGAHVYFNDELSVYEEVPIGQEVRIQWYPDTPIGCYVVEGSTLREAIDEAMKGEGE